jgi:hypothetical protein
MQISLHFDRGFPGLSLIKSNFTVPVDFVPLSLLQVLCCWNRFNCFEEHYVMSEPTLIQDSSLPYKEKLVAGGYVKRSQLPPSRDDSDWSLLLNVVLLPPELIKLKNALFPKVDGKIKHHLFIIHRSSPCLFSYFEVLSVILC